MILMNFKFKDQSAFKETYDHNLDNVRYKYLQLDISLF